MTILSSKMDESNIQVIARVRPLSPSGSQKLCLNVQQGCQIVVGDQSFAFTNVANSDTSQEEVFKMSAQSTADSCLKGVNGTIFAYGQTGSGKTYTIYGRPDIHDHDSPNRGLLPRTIEYLFSKIDTLEQNSNGTIKYDCRISFLEIYNERVYDLLETPQASGANPSNDQSLQIREHRTKGIYVEGLTEHKVKNADEAYLLMLQGNKNRSTGATAMNRESSRSHSVFTIYITATERTPLGNKTRTARFHMIDLAGSERQKDTKAAGDRLKEAGQINKSLSALCGVIRSLVDISQGKDRHIHYRDSKLTMLLRDSLGGNSKTTLIATVTPTTECLAETLSTLKFAQSANLIKNRVAINEESVTNVSSLQEEIKQLRSQLFEYKALSHSSRTDAKESMLSEDSMDEKTGEGIQLAEGMLSMWEFALKDSLQAFTTVQRGVTPPALPAEVSAAALKAILDSFSPEAGNLPPSYGTTALFALAHAGEKLSAIVGEEKLPVLLRCAGSAWTRLQELEARNSSGWNERMEADEALADAQGQLEALQAEKQAAAALLQERTLVEARLDKLIDDIKGKMDSMEGSPVINAPANTTGASTSLPSAPATTGMLQPGFKAGPRRPSISSTSSASSLMSMTMSASTKRMAGASTLQRRPSVSTGSGSGVTSFAVAGTAAARRDSVSSVSSGPSGGSALVDLSRSAVNHFSGLLAELQQCALVLKASSTSMQEATTNSALLAAKSENARLRSLLALAGAQAETISAKLEGKAVVLPRNALESLLAELSAISAESTGLRNHAMSVCDPAALTELSSALETAKNAAELANARSMTLDSERAEALAHAEYMEATLSSTQEELESVKAAKNALEAVVAELEAAAAEAAAESQAHAENADQKGKELFESYSRTEQLMESERSLMGKLDGVEAELQATREQIGHLETQKIENEAQNKILQETVNSLSEQIELLRSASATAAKESHETIQKLSTELEQAQIRLSALEFDVSHWQNIVAMSQADLEKERADNALKLAESSRLHEQELESLKIGHDSAIQELIQLKDAEKTASVATLQQELDLTQVSLSQINEELTVLKAESSELKTNVAALESQIIEKDFSIEAKRLELETLQQDFATLQEDFLKLETTATNSQQEHATLLAQLSCEIDNLKSSLTTAEIDLKGFQSEKINLEKSLTILEGCYEQLMADKGSSEAIRAQLLKEIETQTAESSSLKKNLYEKELALELMKTELSTNSASLAATKEENLHLHTEVEAIKTSLDAMSVDNSVCHANIDSLKLNILSLEFEKSNLTTSVSDLSDKNMVLERDLNTMTQKFEALSKEHTLLQEMLQELKSKWESERKCLMSENDSLKKNLEDMKPVVLSSSVPLMSVLPPRKRRLDDSVDETFNDHSFLTALDDNLNDSRSSMNISNTSLDVFSDEYPVYGQNGHNMAGWAHKVVDSLDEALSGDVVPPTIISSKQMSELEKIESTHRRSINSDASTINISTTPITTASTSEDIATIQNTADEKRVNKKAKTEPSTEEAKELVGTMAMSSISTSAIKGTKSSKPNIENIVPSTPSNKISKNTSASMSSSRAPLSVRKSNLIQ